MAKMVRVEVIVSFSGMRRGDKSTLELTPRVQTWINAGLVRVVDGGKNPARSRRTESDAAGGVPFGAGDSSKAGDESGQGFGAGGYGSSES